jgi:Protein of unknown function (DUF3179)
MAKNISKDRRFAWLLLLLVVIVAIAVVAAPVWIIQPFKAQTDRGVAISYALRRWSPIVTLGAVVISFLLAGWLWRGTRWFAKAALVILLLPLLAATWFARQNHFEWMFHPLPQAAYANVNEATFVSDSDMVLAVENNGEAVAYPVRLMAYHHLVQDVVGGTPIVATY